MANADWSFISDTMDATTVRRGVVTAGVVPMVNGGGSYCYGMNSTIVATGVVALFTNLSNFAPTAKGSQVSAAIQRGVSGGVTGFAPFIFAQLGGSTSADNAYILGLSDSNPAHIELRKGPLALGLPDNAPGSNGVLRRSTITIAPATWVHLRLDCILEPNGDVLLKCFQNDPTAHAVSSPTWVAIPGLDDFTDDALAINSGSTPLTSGKLGYGSYFKDTARRVYFDHITAERQL